MRLKLFATVILLVVAVGAVVISMGGLSPTASAATNLLTAAASVTDVTDEIAATGTVGAVTDYALQFGRAGDATVSWPVTEVKVAVGDRVTSGQALATADTADLEAQIAAATRTAKSAALERKQATTNHDDASTTASLRQTRIALYNAESAEAKATSDLADLQALRDLATIVAPADGIITTVSVTAGSDAPTGPAIEMISAKLQVVTKVVESDVASIRIGQQASVSVPALEASLRGTVTSIDPVGTGSGSNGVIQFAVTVSLDAPPAGLRPGMSADISIVAASAPNVVAIPSRALSGTAGAYTVRVVGSDGAVATRSVNVGLVTSSLAEIRTGLEAGERVVTGTSSTQNQANTTVGGGAFPGGGVIRNAGRP